MPEGDTIHRTAAALRTALLGKPMTAFEAPRLTGAAPAIGSVIERVESRGKHLEIGFDDGVVLHTHMRMSGSWHLYHPGERWRKSARSARVVIEVPGWQAVCFSAPVVETWRHRELTRHPLAGSLGPDLCKLDADLEACVERMGSLAEPAKTMAEVLLDQRIACGVGNVYKSEVLWAVGVHPRSQVGAIDADTRRSLIDTSARLLRANLGGPDRVTVGGGLAVYGRNGKPCLRCAAPIEVARYGEQARVTYWCDGCQVLALLPTPPDSDVDSDSDADSDSEASPRPYEIPRPWRTPGSGVTVPRARLAMDWDDDDEGEPPAPAVADLDEAYAVDPWADPWADPLDDDEDLEYDDDDEHEDDLAAAEAAHDSELIDHTVTVEPPAPARPARRRPALAPIDPLL